MRLSQVRREIALGRRAIFGVIGKLTGFKIPDVAYVVKHRPELFGRAFGEWIHSLLRGPSPWTVGERELFASFTAHLQHCRF